MAANRNTYQQTHNVSVNKNKLVEIAAEDEMSKKDYKVFLVLLSQLDGYSEPERTRSNTVDPKNFRRIDVSAIAEILDLKSKEVRRSIDNLFDLGYLEDGSSDTIANGYRFTF